MHEAPAAHEALRRPVAPGHAVDRREIGVAVPHALVRASPRLAPRRRQPVGERGMIGRLRGGARRVASTQPRLERPAGQERRQEVRLRAGVIAGPGQKREPCPVRRDLRRPPRPRARPRAAVARERMADLVPEHHRELGLVADEGQHSPRDEDPPPGQREGVDVGRVEHREAPPARRRIRRRDQPHAHRPDVAFQRRIEVNPAARLDELRRRRSPSRDAGHAGAAPTASAPSRAALSQPTMRPPLPPVSPTLRRPIRRVDKTQALD